MKVRRSVERPPAADWKGMANRPKDGNRGKKGEPPNQRRRTARLRGDDARMEKRFRQMEREEKRVSKTKRKKK